MTASQIIFWRHGQTDYNFNLRIQGQVDIPLNDTGRQQAADAAKGLAQLTPTHIISSDLSRAADTARALGKLAGLEVATDERLRERRYGKWEGLNHQEIEDGWPEAFRQWRSEAEPDGVDVETKPELATRVGTAVEELAAQAPDDATLVLVSHGAAIAAAIRHLLGLPATWRGFGTIGNCHWSVLAPNRSGEPAWRLLAYNEHA